MIKVWCETCKGTGEIYYDTACLDCNGKGYTEHEGTLEDLELGLATKLAIEKNLEIRGWMGKIRVFMLDVAPSKLLIDWYRDQKGGK